MASVKTDAATAFAIVDEFSESGMEEETFIIVTNALWRDWSRTLNAAPKSPHTIKNMFSAARKVMLSGLSPDHQERLKLHFRLDNSNLGDVKAQEFVRTSGRAFGVIDYDEIELYIGVATDYVTSADIDMAKVGALAVSGRRPSELTKSNFRMNKKNLIFDGQAKMRTRTFEGMGYQIPLLCSEDKFMEAMRVHGSAMLNRSFANIRPALMRFAEDVRWPVNLIPPTPKALRAMYACMTYALYAPPENQEWQWVNSVLGHEMEDTRTCQTYMRFRCPRGSDA